MTIRNVVVVTLDEKIELKSKTEVATASVAAKQKDREREPAADPFFEVKSPLAVEGDRVTVTLC